MSIHGVSMAECVEEVDLRKKLKSHSNLAETHRRLERWQDSCLHSEEHLRLSQQLEDKMEECRALHNLGAVFHAKGKRASLTCKGLDPGCYPPSVTEPLKQSLLHYESNLLVCKSLNDVTGQAKALGNLGNVCYLLGRFHESLSYHSERLEFAEQMGDMLAQRRAHSNLGNAFVFAGELSRAVQHYRQSLNIARDLRDLTTEAQASYAIGNCYTLMKEFSLANQFQARHLEIATRLKDKVGSLRACWSLSNSFASLDRFKEALRYGRIHLSLATELKDTPGIEVAQQNVASFERHLRGKGDSSSDPETQEMLVPDECIGPVAPGSADLSEVVIEFQGDELTPVEVSDRLDHFLIERLLHSQSNRLDEQRYKSGPVSPVRTSRSVDDLLLIIADSQRDRLEEQRAPLRKQYSERKNCDSSDDSCLYTETAGFASFLNRCQNYSLEDQRSPPSLSPLRRGRRDKREQFEESEDFYNLILQAQSHRIDDQRTAAHLPLI